MTERAIFSPSRARQGAGGRAAAALTAAAALVSLTLVACGSSPDLGGHVEQYCASFGPSLRNAARAAASGQRRSIPLGPLARGTGAAANDRMHFCAGARQGWSDPTTPVMTKAQDFAELADRLDALFMQGDSPEDAADDEVAGLLEEMAALADDVAAMPLR